MSGLIVTGANSFERELLPAGNYVARCYQVIQIGKITEQTNFGLKTNQKVRIGWELPLERKVFKPENGEQCYVKSREYNMVLGEKSNLEKLLTGWRGKAFTEEERKGFDISKLIGKPCLLNIVHETATNGNTYEKIVSATPLPKGMTCPEAENPPLLFTYQDWDEMKFELLPDFIKDRMKASDEYKALTGDKTETPVSIATDEKSFMPDDDDSLPF